VDKLDARKAALDLAPRELKEHPPAQPTVPNLAAGQLALVKVPALSTLRLAAADRCYCPEMKSSAIIFNFNLIRF